MGYNSPLFLTIWQLISCDRPQMSIISWIPLGPHWLAHVGCIWVLLQLNFQFVPKNKNPKKSIPWGERSLIEWLNNGKINELHPRRCDYASLLCGLGPPPLWGLVMCYLLFNLGEVFMVWSMKVSREVQWVTQSSLSYGPWEKMKMKMQMKKINSSFELETNLQTKRLLLLR